MEVFQIPETVYSILSCLTSYDITQLATVSKIWYKIIDYIGSLEPSDIDEQIRSAAYYTYIKNKKATEYVRSIFAKHTTMSCGDIWPYYFNQGCGDILISQDPNMIELIFRQLKLAINHMLEIIVWNRDRCSDQVIQHFIDIVHKRQLCHPTTELDGLDPLLDIKDLVINSESRFNMNHHETIKDIDRIPEIWKIVTTRIAKYNDIDRSILKLLDKTRLDQPPDFKEYTWTQISDGSRDHIRYTNKHIRDRYG